MIDPKCSRFKKPWFPYLNFLKVHLQFSSDVYRSYYWVQWMITVSSNRTRNKRDYFLIPMTWRPYFRKIQNKIIILVFILLIIYIHRKIKIYCWIWIVCVFLHTVIPKKQGPRITLRNLNRSTGLINKYLQI